MESSPSSVRIISDCFIKPRHAVEEAKNPIFLTPSDISLISFQYIQKGLFFVKPKQAYENQTFMAEFLETLKSSLSLALVHFYPLAGRLRTLKRDDPRLYTVYVDCGETSPGSKFIHATLDATMEDILSPTYVPMVVKSFFDHERVINHDGHTIPLLSVQVTELVDGVFIGCSMNHSIGDGTSFWNFLNSWSEIHRACGRGGYNGTISRPPVLQRWFPDGCNVPVNLPFSDPTEFVSRFESLPVLLERVFHFSPETIARLKAKANEECKIDKISSFQALTALVWKSITRARRLPADQVTSCWMVTNDRPRMNPPLSPDYFGVSISALICTTTVGELLGEELGWVAWKLHQGVASHTDEKLRQWQEKWLKRPIIKCPGRQSFDPSSILMASSPRFNKYGPDFGLERAVALRSGCESKFDGRISGYPGREGGGSVDLEICLPPERMAALEADEEFMAAVTV